MNDQIVMYSSAWCGYCYRARSLLQSKNVEFQELVVDGNAALRQEMIARTGRLTVPQIFVGERHLGGCDELVSLDRAGKLDALLAESRSTA
jgi:glutaredoxin 3